LRSEDFELLFQNHAQPLFAFLLYRTGDRALAEDVLSDAFERALRSRHSFDPNKGADKTWLYSIALNRLRDLQRRSAVEARAINELSLNNPPETPGFEDDVLDAQAVRRALMTLPENEREALALRFGADLTVPEIAALLGEPLSRVEGRVYRGLRKLRDTLVDPPVTKQ
jgi:RNA polymerase sigma-70 factor (ECF subfamily)